MSNADVVLDLKGLLCPIPVVKVSQAIKSLPVGGVIEATATDPGVLADIPAWTRTTGHELISIERQEKLINFKVRKVK
ncbi:MAG: sulfurtransferase TusA family protein [Chloroflexi bacterium]|nr:sulfurtransferase TusA family protein [Chloroflexota bacterium]MDA8187567.1 sulfurtransferase TusA family protein [Dehalococcoidales bacterium]